MSSQVRFGSSQAIQGTRRANRYAGPTSNINEKHREATLAAAVQFNHFMAATNKAPQGDHLAAYMTNQFLTMNKVCFNLEII